MSTTHYSTGEGKVNCGLNLRISMAVFVWVMFCSFFIVLAELYNIPLGGLHVKLLDVVTVLLLIIYLIRPPRASYSLPSQISAFRRLLYVFVMFLLISALYGFVVNGYPGGIVGSIKVVFQQIWPVLQVLLFFNLGLIFSRHLRFGENLFSGVVTTIALVDILVNIEKLNTIHFYRPLAPQSMMFIFCYLLIFERLIGGRYDYRKVNALCLFCMLVLNFIAIMLTVTRTALGAVVIGTALMLIQKYSAKKIKIKYIVSAIVMILILVVITLKLGLADAFIYRSFNLEDSERIMIWLDAWRMFVDHPLMGVGVGYYINNSMIDSIDLLGGISLENVDKNIIQIASAHNTYLNYLATTGIIGFLFYLTVLVKAMGLIKKQLMEVDWIKTFFYITFFLSLFQESNLFPTNRYTPLFLMPFWFFFGAKLMCPYITYSANQSLIYKELNHD